jgi:hypothetical protein
MANAWTKISQPGVLSQRIAAADNYQSSIKPLAVHPYNERDPDRSTWWLFPRVKGTAGNWPAYHLGKFVFDKPHGRNAIRAGLHVEKGLGYEQAQAFGSGKASGFELKSNWVWHSFVKDLASGDFGEALDDVARRTGLSVEIELSVGAPLDQPELFERYSEYHFVSTQGGRLNLGLVREHKQKLPALRSCSNLAGLATVLERTTTEAPWSWVNVIAGCCVPIGNPFPDTSAPWGGAEFWELALEPLLPWVR